MPCVLCLGIWIHHDIWKSEKLKFDYLKNEKSFQSEIKMFFLVSKVPSFRYKKQTGKNVADTTSRNLSKALFLNVYHHIVNCSEDNLDTLNSTSFNDKDPNHGEGCLLPFKYMCKVAIYTGIPKKLWVPTTL